MKPGSLLFALLPAIAFVGCGSTSSSTDVAPSPVRCNASGALERSSFPASGGSANLVVTAARECSWSVTSDAPWISLSGAQGTGDGQVRYTVSRNSAANVRRGRLALGALSHEVTQQATACQFDVSRRSFEVDSGQHALDVAVDATAGCTWTAKSSANWISITEGSQGSGDGRVRFRAAANTALTPRSGALEVAGDWVEVRQLGSLPKCTYAIVPSSAQSGPQGTEDRVSVQTDDHCAWTAVSDQPWLTIVAGASGTGAGEVRYRAAPNVGSVVRSGRLSVQGAVFTLQQDACRFTLDRTSASFDARSTLATVQVRTSDACGWSAISNASWIVITSERNETGDGRVEYTVRANTTSASRTATMTIAGHAFTVTQTAGFIIEGRAEDVDGSCPTKRFTVRGQRVRTTSETTYDGDNCRDLREGRWVRVRGVTGGESVMIADEVMF